MSKRDFDYDRGFTAGAAERYTLQQKLDRVTAERDAALALIKTHEDAMAHVLEREKVLQQRLTAADERADVLDSVEARYRWLQKATPYQFKKIQDASVTDGGDVLYFHADRFDAAVDDALKPADGGGDEHVCNGCGAKGWTANCKECVPY